MSTVDTELRALDAEIAVKLFGWEWLERIAEGGIRRRAIFAPEGSGWIRWNFDPSRWFVANESTELFADWDRTSSLDDRTNHGLPHYSTDIAAAMSVVEVLRKRFQMVDVGWSYDDNVQPQCRVFGNRGIIAYGRGATAAEAICRAALQAIKSNG